MNQFLKTLIPLFLLSSCMPLAKIIYGIKNPKPKSISYIQKSVKKFELNNFNQYTITGSDFINYFRITKEHRIDVSINELFIFNKNGELIMPKDTNTCSGNVDDVISYYKDKSKFKTRKEVSFQTLFGDSVTSLNDTNNLFMPVQNKFLFVLTWASFAGNLNKINTKYWADSIQSLIDTNSAQAIFINLDLQKNWKSSIQVK